MKDKVCLVTGANTGIGKYTCLGLAKTGAEVILCARNQVQVDKVRQEIIDKTGNDKLHVIIADLSSLEEVVKLSAEVLSRFDKLDVLVNNAGLFLSEYQETANGFETQWAVNYLAPYLLTRRLLNLLINSGPSRIINVSSNGHLRGTIDFEDLNGLNKYNGLKAYSQSKLGNVLFTKELARRLENTRVTAFALHPGLVRTSIGNRNNNSWISWIWNLGKPLMLSPAKGAATTIYVATSPDLEPLNGGYFAKSQPAPASPLTEDNELARRLWEVTEKSVKSFLD